MSDQGPQGYVFAVDERAYCCWEHDHVDRSLSFLDGIDPDYFRAVAEMLAEHVESDLALPASMVLRITYHQAIEALMSLLGALAQAPDCVHAWIFQAKGEAIKQVVGHIDRGDPILTQAGRQRVTFTELAEHVFQCVWSEETGASSTASRFARFWERLATDLLDDEARAEYNALKHGNRVSPGGFTLAIGAEEEYGVAPPPSAMRSLGGSRFGSSFLVVEPVGDKKWQSERRRPR